MTTQCDTAIHVRFVELSDHIAKQDKGGPILFTRKLIRAAQAKLRRIAEFVIPFTLEPQGVLRLEMR